MNKIILMGRLTKDPETRYTSTTNAMVTSFTLAVNRRFAKPTDEKQADFLSIITWNKTAEFCSKYFKKGQQVGVIGRVQTRTYADAQGQKKYVTEVVADEVYFADSKKENSADPMRFEDTFGTNSMPDNNFQVTSDDDLPF